MSPLLAALLAIFTVLVLATARLIYSQPRGRHHMHIRTRVRVHLGRKHR